MSTLKLKYIKHYRDRLGIERYYFNRPGSPATPLPGLPGSRAFMAAYAAALEASEAKVAPPRKAGRVIEGSFADLVNRYYASSGFRSLAPITRSSYRNEVEKLVKSHGDKPIAMLDRRGVKKMLSEKADRPGAANKLLRTLKMLMRFAIDEEMRSDDPTLAIRPLKIEGDGFLAWSEDDILKFEARHPIGSKARLAFSLLLYTGQRRGDVVRMGRQHVRGDRIAVVQNKTGTALEIPIHPELARTLKTAPTDIPAFLMTEFGKPFVPTGFGNWFRDRCAEAGLPKGYNAHGLRKAAARRLAEAGATSHEIASITGHRTLAEVERYTRSANQVLLAEKAMARITPSSF